MSTIHTFCPRCAAPVSLGPAEVLVLPGTDASGSGTYLFLCTACGQVAAKPAGPANLALLAAAGAAADRPQAPEPPVGAPPFTCDDLLDFHLLLATDDRLVPLLPDAGR
jgi:hypothetical protein